MHTKLMKIAAIVISSACLAGAATADLIAGWDFSQYKVDGALVDDSGATNTLSANYSAQDPNGAGAESALYGTMFLNGAFGSTNVNPNAASPGPIVVPHAMDTKANRNAPYDASASKTLPLNVFDAFNLLRGEGQGFSSRLGITARSAADVVFRGDFGPGTPAEWGLSFAGKAISPTGTVEVDVEFDNGCVGSYSNVGSVNLTEVEQTFSVSLSGGTISASSGCVRLGLDPANGQPVIDNVAVTAVPEPGMAAMLLTGILAIFGLKRRLRA